MLDKVSQLFLQATHLYEVNAFEECEKILQQILHLKPQGPEAISLLANLYIKNSLPQKALDLHSQLVVLDPNNDYFYFQKGNLEVELKQFSEAFNSFSKAIEIKPNHASYLCSMGFTLIQMNYPKEAHLILEQALKIEPNNFKALFYLGVIFFNQKSYSEALIFFNNAYGLSPNLIQLITYKARCLMNLGQYQDAITFLKELISQENISTNPEILSILGLSYINTMDLNNAAHFFQLAAEKDPTSSIHYSNLSGAQFSLLDLDGALKSGLKAIELDSKNPEALNNLGSIYLYLGEIDWAIEYFQKVLDLEPNNFSAHSNKLFCESMTPRLSKETNFINHCSFGKQLLNFVEKNYPKIELKNDLNPHKLLNIGFVSGDFRDHAVSNLIEPVIQFLDRDKFRLFAFSNHPSEDSVSQRLKQYFFSWNKVYNFSDFDLAQLIRDQKIDILFDLSGHTGNNRLAVFAIKPAPIQITWIGYPLTTGIPTVDYTFLDHHASSGTFDALYVEKIIYLPQSFPFQPANPSPSVNQLPALENGYVTLGMFNNSRKFSLESIGLWGKVLQLIPNSKLIFAGVSNAIFQKKLYESFTHLGIEASRISVQPQLPLFEFLELFHKVDFCLDTFPYSGGTTSAHSLWMGVPVLSLSGETIESNQTTAHLLAHGLGDWSCPNIEDYCSKAKYWSEHLHELSGLREGLRKTFEYNESLNRELFAEGLGQALVQIWQRYCAGLQPESFRLEKPTLVRLSKNRLQRER